MAARPNLPDTGMHQKYKCAIIQEQDGSKEQLILPSETDAVTKDNQLEKAVIDSADQGSVRCAINLISECFIINTLPY